MAVNRIRGAFTVPKKGETFELRAGLVYERSPFAGSMTVPVSALLTPWDLETDHNMPTSGMRPRILYPVSRSS